jgi:rubredoxin
MKELVRCKPCGYVMEADKLGDVCPACGMPRKAFEPYRERVALNRLFVLSLDMHPIAIHLSQTFVILIPAMILLTTMFPGFQYAMFSNVLHFAVVVFPFTLVIAIITGITDGLFRFKTLTPPLLKTKILYSSIIIVLGFVMFFVAAPDHYGIITIILSLGSLACAVRLGLLGKQLIDVILPGSYPIRRAKMPVKEIKNEAPTQQ